jgi:putative tricarboxylic transport membrane protein
MDESDSDGARPSALGSRWPEVAVALVLVVIADSIRVGIGLGDDGPRSGYLPFYIGLTLVVAAGSILVGQLLRWKRDGGVFADRAQLAGVFAVAWPMAVYVALIAFTGIDLASAALIGWFMQRHGRYGWAGTVSVSLAVPVVFFLVFERWFLVPLPKGPIEAMLGC